jgi:hypothetical protein
MQAQGWIGEGFGSACRRLRAGGDRRIMGVDARAAKLEAVLVENRADAKGIPDELRVAIAQFKSDIIKWICGTLFAAVAILLSAMFFWRRNMFGPLSNRTRN